MATETLSILKSIAKKLARSRRLQHSHALETVARHVGKANWRGLTESYKQGWRPDATLVDRLELALFETTDNSLVADIAVEDELAALGGGLVFTRWSPEQASPIEADEVHGELDGNAFYLVGDEFQIAFGSQGWEILLDQAPSAKPKLRRLGGRVKSVEALEPAFVERATQILKVRARRMYAEVASQWPRRSTMPDQQGRALHPLNRGLSDKWYCLHCDGVHDGQAMATNLWHCTTCGATPIDIFQEPFWTSPTPSA